MLRRPRRPPRACGPVLDRKTSSSVGACSWKSRDREALGVERAHDRGERSAPPCEPHGGGAGRRGRRRRRTARAPRRRASRSRAVGRGRPRRVGRPISAFSASGVPSATMWPWSMIPTRSARTSASSRYCVVRKTVTPSSRASRATSSHRSARLAGSRPVVGSSRNRTRGRVDEREREVEPALHAARVAADLAVGGVVEARRARAARRRARGARRFGRPWSVVCSRRWSRPVSSGSSAASCSAAPIDARTAGPSRTMSWPATRAVPAVGGSSVVSISTVVDLPAPFGPEEAVDLAGLRRAGRCRRRRAGRS